MLVISVNLRSPWSLIALGFILVMLGWIGPFLMVIHVIPSTFFLNFLSYIASVLGLFLGIWGVALYTRSKRK
jgi:apolipoprotein N-acyltransferase